MENAIVIAILFIVVGGAGYYIFKKKKTEQSVSDVPAQRLVLKNIPPDINVWGLFCGKNADAILQ